MVNRWLILTSVACGTFMATLDSSIVNVALPSITYSFHTGLSHSRWVIISYLFSIAGLLLFFGKLADTIGRKTVFNTGFVIFTAGSLLCGLAQSIGQLIFFRGLQGLGASMLMANGPAIITATFPLNERGRALGLMGMVVSAGLAIGPSLGGVLIGFFGWPSIFFVNIPFGIAGAIMTWKYMPDDIASLNSGGLARPDTELTTAELMARHRRLPPWVRIQSVLNQLRLFDWLGAILWMVIQLGYSMIIDRDNVLGISGPVQKIFSAAAMALFFMFLVWELSIEDPVLNLSLFKSRVFRNGNIAAFLTIVGMSSLMLLMPFYLQNVRNHSSLTIGLVMTAIPITMFIAAPIAGRLADTYGSRVLAVLGCALMSASLLLMGSTWGGIFEQPDMGQSIANVVAHLCLMGAGFGIFQSPNSKAVLSDVETDKLGMASALLATVRNLGLVTGTALSSMLLMSFYRSAAASNVLAPSGENFVLALRETFYIIGALTCLAIPAAAFIGVPAAKEPS